MFIGISLFWKSDSLHFGIAALIAAFKMNFVASIMIMK